MRKGDKIVRVKEESVNLHLNQGYEFCPKNVWITNVRDINKKKVQKTN